MTTVAFLTTSYPSSPEDPSGHFVRAEALALTRRGFRVHVFAPAPFSLDPGIFAHPCGGTALLSWPGVVTRLRQHPARAFALPPFALRALAGLRRLCPDVLHAHWALPCAWPLGFLASPPTLHITFHGADVRLLLSLPAPVRVALMAQLLRAQLLRFVASSLLDTLASALPPRMALALQERACIEPPQVIVEPRIPPLPLPWEHYAVTLGRLISSKRTELAIQAVAQVPGWGLVMVGDGPEQGTLERLAQVLLPGRHRFTGRLGRPEALGYLAGASVLLHPSAEEAAPTVVLEAIALGIPVVTCGAGDTARWAETQEGLEIVEPTATALAQAKIFRKENSPAHQ
ncbi:MAG: glycosyltransferase [Polyangiaceae bacterium]|nr:glycosyltransferase [Polyangiaceae bacterium]